MRRAFVIQLDREATIHQCDGRIEHVDSGQSTRFHSLEEAVTFVIRVISETEQLDPIAPEPLRTIENEAKPSVPQT